MSGENRAQIAELAPTPLPPRPSPTPDSPEGVLRRLHDRVANTVVGYDDVVRALTIALVTQGHVLLEGTPGIAKTLLVRRFSDSLDLQFKRIQFTPDMLPSDIVGNVVLNPVSRQLEYRPGPVFANVVLADEINRAPPKVQSALLEAMQERQVTIDGVAHPLPEPFVVIATQNPIEQEGTYPLPEAELDRLLFRVLMGYPSRDEERQLNRIHSRVSAEPDGPPVVDGRRLLEYRDQSARVHLSDEVLDYIIDLIRTTRTDGRILVGASPRAGVQLTRSAKAFALFSGRSFVTPHDVKSVAFGVLNHRLTLKPEVTAQHYTESGIGSEPAVRAVLGDLLDRVPAPR
ncbi:MAG: MoxR family ATPase [Thermoplasmata archaeon]|nr:MoxR family ATPase [Thermoplasmata archaeon]